MPQEEYGGGNGEAMGAENPKAPLETETRDRATQVEMSYCRETRVSVLELAS